MFDAATSEDYSRLHLQISSDDARVLAWPWEALRDRELGYLAQTCQIERRLNKLRDPQPLPASLPRNRVNILLVVARPYGRRDVGYRSIARPLGPKRGSGPSPSPARSPVPFGSRGAEGPTTFLLPTRETGLPVASWLKGHFITTLPKAWLRSRVPRALSSRRMREVCFIIRRAFDPDAPWEG